MGSSQNVGSHAWGYHQGARSEYLAQYVFSSFGTSIPVPRQEDTGIDLYCTLDERDGNLSWPKYYYTVQVKSVDRVKEKNHIVFGTERSVRQLVEQPLPFYLCIVDKSRLQLSIYQTSGRFALWASHSRFPNSIALVPGERGVGQHVLWEEGSQWQWSLRAPIAEFSITEIQEKFFFERIVACSGNGLQSSMRISTRFGLVTTNSKQW